MAHLVGQLGMAWWSSWGLVAGRGDIRSQRLNGLSGGQTASFRN